MAHVVAVSRLEFGANRVPPRLDFFQTRSLYVKVNGVPNKAMADQITTASKQRLREKAGKIDPAELAGVERAIKTQLGLD